MASDKTTETPQDKEPVDKKPVKKKAVEEKPAGEKTTAEKTSETPDKVSGDAPTEGPTEEPAKKKKKKKGKKRTLNEAKVYIHASYNNTIVTVAEMNGNVVCWASAGGCGFKGTRKATPYAASVAVETALTKAKALGVERVHISMKGIGTGRDQALRAINATGVFIESIEDRTAVPHNGCRSRKARRV